MEKPEPILENNHETKAESKQKFIIHKIYIKESSFASKNVPEVFKKEWKPEVTFNMENKTKKLENNLQEIDLAIAFTIKLEGQEICTGKVLMSGIFALEGFTSNQLEQMIISYCPNILYPFIREAIADMISRGGYPQILIAPLNFDAVYAELLKQREQEAAKESEKATKH
jgi:preprotein translocase subunit SecB